MTTRPAKKASREDWHPADIKAALHKRGITLAGIAKVYGLRDSTSLSSCFVRSYPANEKRIADALGVHPKEIWPSRYYENGEPKPRGFRAVQCNAASRVVNGNLALAA
ncbi:MAG: DNA-binding transcriptional regulator Nlp [Betaproteobacteria bacterium ADurb.Bin341]|nr:MAG: DNA-binding transcriptional regulator Nlp [Betaproteobacteria bacterium ADurb.Bin341]